MKSLQNAALLLLPLLLLHPLASPAAGVPVPAPPQVAAKSYFLMDHHSGRVLAEHNADARMEPASIVKLMTAYAVFDALRSGKLRLDEKVTISEHAWRTGGAATDGSTSFMKVGSQVPVEALLQGMIVQSGNDASIALAERLGGDETTFAQLMNNYARELGMTNSNFENSTGLPSPNAYMTARDIALLGNAMIREFPQYYRWYSQPSFTWNGIRQNNRNGLLSRDPSVDGMKTGYTRAAGHCLAASARREGMRLISVVLGAQSFRGREDANLTLLNYGFSFFETKTVYSAGRPLTSARVWKADRSPVGVGLPDTLHATVPRGRFADIKASATLQPGLMAPLDTVTPVGELRVTLGDETIATRPLYALQAAGRGGLWTRMLDSVLLWFE
jgi:D-alanyl-D-alanine carboxypeptidase (penicillin-binding protein 5/6)